VIYKCKGDLRPDLMIEILEHSTIEILSTVDRDLLRNSVTTDDILLEKILDGVRGYNCYWFRFNPFGEVLSCDNDEGVVSLCSCKFSHDIDALLLQGHAGAINSEGCVGAMQRWENFLQASHVATNLAASSIIVGQ
jgi:hypothetical protein